MLPSPVQDGDAGPGTGEGHIRAGSKRRQQSSRLATRWERRVQIEGAGFGLWLVVYSLRMLVRGPRRYDEATLPRRHAASQWKPSANLTLIWSDDSLQGQFWVMARNAGVAIRGSLTARPETKLICYTWS